MASPAKTDFPTATCWHAFPPQMQLTSVSKAGRDLPTEVEAGACDIIITIIVRLDRDKAA